MNVYLICIELQQKTLKGSLNLFFNVQLVTLPNFKVFKKSNLGYGNVKGRFRAKLREENEGDLYFRVSTKSDPKRRHLLSLNLKIFKKWNLRYGNVKGGVSVLKLFEKNEGDIYSYIRVTSAHKMRHQLSPILKIFKKSNLRYKNVKGVDLY